MYRYSNGQIRLSDFKQPMGMNLKEDNRWVKRALLIPWNDIEKRYAAHRISAFKEVFLNITAFGRRNARQLAAHYIKTQ